MGWFSLRFGLVMKFHDMNRLLLLLSNNCAIFSKPKNSTNFSYLGLHNKMLVNVCFMS